MKKLLLRCVSVLAFVSWTFNAQSQVSAYTFSQSNGTYAEITGGTVMGSGTIDDNNYNARPIGFNFNYNGTVYTQFSANANGFLALGATVASSYTALSGGATNNVVSALNFDLQGTATAALRFELTGTAPNQILVVQWKGFRAYGATGDLFDFQIRLHEGTNVVEIVYGNFVKNATNQTSQVGLRGSSNADFNNRTTATDWTATTAGLANNNTVALQTAIIPTSGLTFTWTPPSCLNPGSLNAINVTGIDADLTWIAGSSETVWDLYYGPTPLTAPTGATIPTMAGVTSNTQNIGGLTPLTQYTYYVRADCGSSVYSGWAGPYTFRSGCPNAACNYTFNLSDSYGDGWNGASVQVRVAGITVATVGTGFTTGTTFSQTVSICEGETLELVWTSGSYPEECGFTMLDPFSNTVSTFAFLAHPTNGSTFFTGTGNCTPPAIDMQAIGLATPGQICFTNNETIDLTIRNNSGNIINFAANPVDVNVSVTGPNPQTFTTVTLNTGTLAAGATAVVAITTGYDMSAPGTYAFSASTTVAGDAIPGNDAMPTANRIKLAAPSPLPLVENFNAGLALPVGFSGSASVQANNGTLNSNGLTTNLYGGNTYADVDLPYLGILPANSTMEFDYRVVDYSGYPSTATTLAVGDSINLKFSTDCGGTYSMLMSINSTNHTPSLNFVRPLIDLSPYAGQTILLRWEFTYSGTGDYYMDIDNINIREVFANDAGVTVVSDPTSGCGLSATENITVSIRNFGTVPLVNPDVAYKINGGAAVTETTALTIAPGTTSTYTFTAAEDFSAAGAYLIKAYTLLAGDGDLTNDTTQVTVNSIATFTPDYFTDLELNDAGFIPAGANQNWAWGDPNSGIITDGNGCGMNAWVTGLTANYNTNTNATLTTACFDFTGSAAIPMIRFDNIYRTEAGYDQLWMEYSTDAGATWTKLLPNAGNTGWYSNVGLNVWEGTSANNTWMVSSNPLNGLEGTIAMFRYVFISDGSVQYEGVGIDNFFVGYNYNDAKATAVTSPVSACGLSNSENITATFTNTGSSTLTSMDVCYILDGGSPICETLNGSFAPGATVTHTFIITGDFSLTGAHTLLVVGSATSDNSLCDTVSVVINNVPTISTYPHIERFENGTAGWSSGGTGNTWAFGTPAKTNIIGAASGVNAWVNGGLTGTHVAGENSWVISPCYEVATMPTNPWVAVKINWFSEFSFDGAVLQMTKDNGATWTNVGTNGAPYQGNPYNWYNDNTISGNPGAQTIGWTGTAANSSNGWIIASHPIDTTGFSLITSVRFRIAFGADGSVEYDGVAFDDFAIGTPPQVDLGIDISQCGNITVAPTLDINGTYVWTAIDTATNAVTNAGNGISLNFNDPASSDSIANVKLAYRDTLGFYGTDTVLLTSLEVPLIGLGIDTAICYNDTLVLHAIADPAYSYSWNTGSILDSIIVTTNGMYTLTTTVTGNGCNATDDQMVYIKPAVDLPATASICDGTPAVLNAGTGYVTYNWSTTETTSSITVGSTGNYFVSTTDTIGCISSDTVMVSNQALPSVDLGNVDTLICVDDIITLDAGTGFASYSWSDGSSNSTTTANAATLGLGTHEYSVTIIDANGCTNADTIDVMVDACVGIEEIENNYITLYPNPNTGSFIVNFGTLAGEVRIEIYTVEGKLIYSSNKVIDVNSTQSFELENKIPGMYILKVSNNNTSAYQRFILN